MAKKKIALSDGHGSQTPGKRTPDGYNENKFNKGVVNYLENELDRCGFEVKQLAPTDSDTPLKTRTDAANAWGADAYVAVHYNALKSVWRDGEGGIETFYYPGSTEGKKLATAVHKQLVKGTDLKDRGVKSGNLHEVRESHMPAALVECGFMDIKREAGLMKSIAYQKECAIEIAKGICDFFNVPYKEDKKEATNVAAEYELTKEEQAMVNELRMLGITDGKHPTRPVTQLYLWQVAYGLIKAIREGKVQE